MTFWTFSDLFIYSYKYVYKLYICYNFSFFKANCIISYLQLLVHMCPQSCKGLYTRPDGYVKALNRCCYEVSQQNGRGSSLTSWSLEQEMELTSPGWIVGGWLLQSCAVHRGAIGGALLLPLWEVLVERPGLMLCLCLWKACKTPLQDLRRNVI